LKVTVIGACERRIWPPGLRGFTVAWHQEPVDAGVIQSDDVTVDEAATRTSLDRWLRALPGLVRRESSRLEGVFDLVIGDVPSAAFAAARATGIPGVAIANFSWDWIYSELGYEAAAAAAAAGYAMADLLLEATPFGPMPAFPRRRGVGLVARAPSKARRETRAALGIAEEDRAVLLAFQPASAPRLALPPPRQGRRWLTPARWPRDAAREDVTPLPDGFRFEDALAAADVVLGKPGYGLLGDVEVSGVRFLYVPRPDFPENAVLEEHLASREGTRSLSASLLATGAWEDVLVDLEQRPRPEPADPGGAARAAEAIADLLDADRRIDSGRRAD
jgi:L-arabinokinase